MLRFSGWFNRADLGSCTAGSSPAKHVTKCARFRFKVLVPNIQCNLALRHMVGMSTRRNAQIRTEPTFPIAIFFGFWIEKMNLIFLNIFHRTQSSLKLVLLQQKDVDLYPVFVRNQLRHRHRMWHVYCRSVYTFGHAALLNNTIKQYKTVALFEDLTQFDQLPNTSTVRKHAGNDLRRVVECCVGGNC